MENNISSQINISMPNLINICVNEKEHGEIKGQLYHCYAKDSVLFGNVIELLTIAEKLYDTICFPQASTKTRTFLESELQVQTARPEKVAASTDVISHRWKIGSFVLCVRFRQNSTWQGEVFWLEKGIGKRFSNTLDFIKILDSAVNTIE